MKTNYDLHSRLLVLTALGSPQAAPQLVVRTLVDAPITAESFQGAGRNHLSINNGPGINGIAVVK